MQSWRKGSHISILMLAPIVYLREAKDCTDQVSYVILLYMKTWELRQNNKVLKYFSNLLRTVP